MGLIGIDMVALSNVQVNKVCNVLKRMQNSNAKNAIVSPFFSMLDFDLVSVA